MAAALSFAFTPTPLTGTTKLVIEATRPVSAGKAFMPRSEYKVVSITSADPTSPVDILTAYNAIFGAFTAGEKIFLRGRLFSSSYFAGAPINTSVVVA